MDEGEKSKLDKEREDLLVLIQQLEEEHRKANITDNVYREMKEKYDKKLEELNKKLGIKEEKDKGGILEKLFKKKKQEVDKDAQQSQQNQQEPVFIDPLNPPQNVIEEEPKKEDLEEKSGEGFGKIFVELEKIRAFIDSLKDMNKSTNEQIRTLSESIGEVRSMVFQVDASLKELELKVEKLEDSVKEISPEKYEKKIREIDSNFEKLEVFKEITNKKIDDIVNSLTKVNELLKSVGSIENFLDIYKIVNDKVNEIKEAISYIEKIAVKTEKSFIEMNKYLQDFVFLKEKQNILEEEFREMNKNLEEINSKLENVATLKDIDAIRYDFLTLKNQIEEINKVLPIVETKIPETIIKLREERDDLLTLIKSLEEQSKEGKISKKSYEESKKKALRRLEKIREELIREWKKIESFIESGGMEQIPLETRKIEVQEKSEETPVKIQQKVKEGTEFEDKKELETETKDQTEKKEEKEENKKEKSKKDKSKAVQKQSRVEDEFSKEKNSIKEVISSITKDEEDKNEFLLELLNEFIRKKKESEERKKKKELLIKLLLEALE
ncbi:MAG: hypothetical protein N3D78_03135 [Candidatus Aenigmarchaeota archaeon]|nr:hypothetical protein [Candidatus Aenigmarchaeota archaeon]